MKAIGTVRKLDSLGRIVIPKEIRRIYELDETTPLEIFIGEDSNIILRKYLLSCSLCGKDTSNLNSYLKAKLCDDCFKLVTQK